MLRIRRVLSVIVPALLVVTASVAQTAKPAAKKAPAAQAGGILQPQMTPTLGTYAAPGGTLGEKPAQPWSTTTIEASVDGKPNPGKVQTVVGEIVDFSCYLQLGKHGDKHRDCAQKCFRNGMPIGLLAKDGSVYMLMEEEHHPRRDGQTNFRDAAIEHAGHIMEVSGTLSTVDHHKALFVTGFKK